MFGQIIIPVRRKPDTTGNDRIYIVYNAKGVLIRGSREIPEGQHPTVFVPIFEYEKLVKTLKLNARQKMTPEQRRESQRASLKRHRARKKRGEVLPRVSLPRVLSDDEVLEIRRLSSEGQLNVDIARMKGVSPSLVSKIINNHRRTTVI